MEIEGLENGSKTQLKSGFKREFGRGLGFDSNERTVSRRHVSFELDWKNQTGPNSKSRVFFEVIGKNPIWVCSQSHGNGEIRVFRKSERGEMEGGDMFCFSSKNPVWFALRRTELEGEDENDVKREIGNENENELAERLENSYGLKGVEDLELEDVDVSDIDPVKEFGFLIIGHEFDHYSKKMIRDPKTWNWFLEEPKEESDDDEISERKRKRGTTGKRKKGHGNGDDDDDDWTGESEEDKESITKSRKLQKPKYSTRSKDRDKSTKDVINRGNEEDEEDQGKEEDEDEDEDEEDETLGGFIVDEENVEEGEEEEEEEEEEEDYDDDDDE